MSLTRKITLGVVGKSSKKKERDANTRLLKEQTKAVKAQRKGK